MRAIYGMALLTSVAMRGVSIWAQAVEEPAPPSPVATSDKRLDSPHEPELARELLKRQEDDQRLRTILAEAFARLKPGETSVPMADVPEAEALGNVDARNTEFMKATLKEFGWPGISLVGREASAAAWLLVQHADHDPEFQAEALELLTEAYGEGEATGQQVAYLTDRVRLKQGKKQVYGTQFVGHGADARPAPIEDELHVDIRRKEVGLPPLAEYARLFRPK